MQLQLDDIADGERLVRQGGEEEFVDHTCTRDAHTVLLGVGGMGGYHYAAGHALGSYRYLRTIVETATCLAFWTLLELVSRQVQTGLNERVIEHAVLFAPGDKCEACHIGERRSCPILAVESE